MADLGSAIIGIGDIWGNAIQQKRIREQRDQQMALQQQHQAAQLALQEREFNSQNAAREADQLYKQAQLQQSRTKEVATLADQFPGRSIPTAAIGDISPAAKAMIFSPLGKRMGSTQLAGAVPLPGQGPIEGAGPLQQAQGTPGVSEELSQINPGESSKIRSALEIATQKAAATEAGRGQQQTQFDARLAETQRNNDMRFNALMAGVASRNNNGEPMVPVQQDDGSVVYVPRSEAAGKKVGKVGGGGAGGAANANAANASEVTLRNIDLINQSNPKNYVGGMSAGFKGKRSKFSAWSGYGLTPELAQLSGAVAEYNNNIMHLLSGAAVSPTEEARLRLQLLDLDQPEQVFNANLKRATENTEFLLSRQKARMGALGVQGSMDAAAGKTPKVTISSIEEIK